MLLWLRFDKLDICPDHPRRPPEILHARSCPGGSYIFQLSWKLVEWSQSCGGGGRKSPSPIDLAHGLYISLYGLVLPYKLWFEPSNWQKTPFLDQFWLVIIVFLWLKATFTWDAHLYTTLNRHRSPIKVVNRQFWVKKLLRVVSGDLLWTGHVILRMRSKLCSLHNGKTLFFAYNMA